MSVDHTAFSRPGDVAPLPGAAGVRSPAGSGATTDEVMAVVASRELVDATTCFVGIGIPSTAANLARRLHAPRLVLVYESGAIGAKPGRLPLSIGDGELADSADAVVSVPEVFNYWLQGGHIDVGMLGAAQVDRFANLNTTVIGEYASPSVRLPGAGGAPEIAASCGEVVVVVHQSTRTFVAELDFVTTVGHGDGPGARERLGLRGRGPSAVVTDLGVLRPDPVSRELVLDALHPGVSLDIALAATGWPLRVAPDLSTTTPPSHDELAALRALVAAGARRP
ncbi:MAG TPA: CoA-transferase [Acidimicrobiales bacterium]|nr:CoA-transferase [Acidimicrobiales bacterium]